jgi:predicted RNA binding protein YcfA (HicA-like mRNA interferase family)
MTKTDKLLHKLISGHSKNVRFKDFTALLNEFDFYLDRVSGSHHIFINRDIREIINIQNIQGEVKPYQIRQFLKLIEKYGIKKLH